MGEKMVQVDRHFPQASCFLIQRELSLLTYTCQYPKIKHFMSVYSFSRRAYKKK